MTGRKHKLSNSVPWTSIVLSLALVASILGASGRVRASVSAAYTVTNTDDSGPGSLRQALLEANSNAGPDTIAFDIPGSGLHTISPLSALPAVSGEVIIDGLTQGGASCDSWPPTLLVEIDGSSAGAGVDGLQIQAGNSIVRGLVINRFDHDGILLDTNGGNTIACNYIGAEPDGSTAAGNGRHGIFIYNVGNNLIGGTTTAERNLISGNAFQGIQIGYGSGAAGNRIEGNYIGVDASGAAALGNAQNGVSISGGQNNTVGGTAAGARNIISGNYHGLSISSNASDTLVQGNYIGPDVTGLVALGNDWNGLRVRDSQNTTIGGTVEGARNIIAGNGQIGLTVGGSSTGTVIQGNYIGVDATGSTAMGNGGGAGTNNFSGLSVSAPSSGATIGGATANAGNIIAANFWDGIRLDGSSGNVIQGNHIGAGIDGTEVLGNARCGVSIRTDASNNVIGGRGPGEANLIAHNSPGNVEGNGVCVFSGTGNLISGNSIFDNENLGIDLGVDGVTDNDDGDTDTGANNLQNYPELTSAAAAGGSIVIDGALNSLPNTTFSLEFFCSRTEDASGHGEGKSYLGSTVVSTDGGGDTTFSANLPGAVPDGSFISATATDPNDNTSEFGANIAASGATAVVIAAFGANQTGNDVRLEWETAVEVDSLGFNLYRSDSPDSPDIQLNDTLIPGKYSAGCLGGSYEYVDQFVEPGKSYYYWLEDVDVYSVATLHGPVSVTTLYRSHLPIVYR